MTDKQRADLIADCDSRIAVITERLDALDAQADRWNSAAAIAHNQDRTVT